ncbi:MAG: hypothetical protein QF880_05090 [Candidatus Poseidonia sp.]|nr:hypothetical protein [Poseidonia sp.]
MRWLTAWALVLLLFAVPIGAQADEGRAAPSCLTQDGASLPPTLDIDPDVCVIVDLGLLQPGDVYEIQVIVVDDAIDLLFFDENSIQPYELGQSYRSVMAQPASTESALGGYEFHWKVPPSISAKRWYMVLDNSAHDGDAGQGDQGGLQSTVSATVNQLTQAYWTPFNDLLAVDAGAYDVLLSGDDLRLDAGTTVVLSAWDLTFVGDVYLQTRTMHDRYTAGGIGVKFIEGGALQAVESPQSLTWQVPSSLEGEELLLVVDNTDNPLGGGNGTEALRMTVRLELAPPLTPTITDEQMATVSLGEAIILDASSTPNRLNQQGTFVWDIDANVDSNEDGNPTNDPDASGLSIEASWSTPGSKTITVKMTAPSGEEAMTSYAVAVEDTVAPNAIIQGGGDNVTLVSNGWRVNVDNSIEMSCQSSSDDHLIERCDWTVDGQSSANLSVISFTPDELRDYTVVLTVTDMSGNAGNTTAVVKSVDPTLPTFDTSLLAAFPTVAETGDALEFEVAVSDTFDTDSSLRVHWDLQPSKDTDGNGNTKDDPDRVGLKPSITFDSPGLKEIVVTVFDGSNNTANYAFSVDISSAPERSVPYTGGITVLGILLVVGAGGLAFNRAVQQNRGFNLLIERGLNREEAQAHMAMTAQRSKLTLFSKAEDFAGLNLGEVVSEDERVAAQKQAEMDAIYGSTAAGDPNAGFAQAAYVQAPLSDASQQAASEAAALLSGDLSGSAMDDSLDHLVEEIAGASALPAEAPTPVSMPLEQASEGASTVSIPSVDLPDMDSPVSAVDLPTEMNHESAKPVSSGISVPEMPSPPVAPAPAPTPPPPPAPTSVRHTCSSCQAQFELDIPAGIQHAVVACPACGVDQTISAND